MKENSLKDGLISAIMGLTKEEQEELLNLMKGKGLIKWKN